MRLAACPNPEMEAVFAAQEIIRLVRDRGGRYREAAALVRDLEGYGEHLRRVFTRYGIPYFLDRREAASHHPLAELTRSTLRGAVFDWSHDDWFGALKTGLVSPDADAIDRLENEALRRGWRGEMWFRPLPGDGETVAAAGTIAEAMDRAVRGVARGAQPRAAFPANGRRGGGRLAGIVAGVAGRDAPGGMEPAGKRPRHGVGADEHFAG